MDLTRTVAVFSLISVSIPISISGTPEGEGLVVL